MSFCICSEEFHGIPTFFKVDTYLTISWRPPDQSCVTTGDHVTPQVCQTFFRGREPPVSQNYTKSPAVKRLFCKFRPPLSLHPLKLSWKSCRHVVVTRLPKLTSLCSRTSLEYVTRDTFLIKEYTSRENLAWYVSLTMLRIYSFHHKSKLTRNDNISIDYESRLLKEPFSHDCSSISSRTELNFTRCRTARNQWNVRRDPATALTPLPIYLFTET